MQRAPELLSYLQVRVDEKRGNGRYVLTGSHQSAVRAAIGQSLAGRTAILQLLPLSIAEMDGAGIAFDSFADFAWHGGLPRVHDEAQRPSVAYANYFRTYVERDVRQLLQLKDAALFEKFLRLLAGRAGQVLNLQSLGNDTGIDAKTVKHWLTVLEASFIVFTLLPWFENVGKRVIKSPKVYFTEPGLLVWLLGIDDPRQLVRDPLVGSVFENLVIVEALKARVHRGKRSNLYFHRDYRGLEIDLIIANGRALSAIEIKSAATLDTRFTEAFAVFEERVAPLVSKTIVYSGRETRSWRNGAQAVGFREVERLIAA